MLNFEFWMKEFFYIKYTYITHYTLRINHFISKQEADEMSQMSEYGYQSHRL